MELTTAHKDCLFFSNSKFWKYGKYATIITVNVICHVGVWQLDTSVSNSHLVSRQLNFNIFTLPSTVCLGKTPQIVFHITWCTCVGFSSNGGISIPYIKFEILRNKPFSGSYSVYTVQCWEYNAVEEIHMRVESNVEMSNTDEVCHLAAALIRSWSFSIIAMQCNASRWMRGGRGLSVCNSACLCVYVCVCTLTLLSFRASWGTSECLCRWSMIEIVSSRLTWSPKCITGMSHHYPRHLAYLQRNSAFFPFLSLPPLLDWTVHMLLLESSLFQHTHLFLKSPVSSLRLQFWSLTSSCAL